MIAFRVSVVWAKSIATVALLFLGATRVESAAVAIDQGPAPQAAAKAYFGFLSQWAPGMVEPVVFTDADGSAGRCETGAKAKTHAVIVGASDAGLPFSRLTGPDNDAALLSASLRARGVDRANLHAFSGGNATRERVIAGMSSVIADVNCGDRVLFYFGGNAARSRDLLDEVLPPDLRKRFEGITIDDKWSSDFRNQTHLPTIAMRWAERNDLFLALDGEGDGVLQVIGSDDVSDFVTLLRNRMVDVAVILDTSYASAADLAARQQRAGENRFWTLETGGEALELPPLLARYRPTPLQPNHGAFAALYSSIGDSHSVEVGFDNPDGSKTTYGVFTLRLANAIQNRQSLTVRTLGESLRSVAEHSDRNQRHRVEASDPEMALFSDGSLNLPRTDPITITEPTPKRGATTVDRPEVRIAGRVDWSTPARAVLVDGKVATLVADGSFTHTAPLQSGLNTIEIVALTRDGRTHERRLEFIFEGDKQALEGEGARYAVIVANQNYGPETGFDSLVTPFADVEALTTLLSERYGFRTEATLPTGQTVPLLLKDATRRDIETVLYQIGLVAGEKDTVLIYYAGHGIYEEKTTIAFWVPSDAVAGVPISYLSASTIVEAVQRMQANNILVVSDSCFSGALMRGGGTPPDDVTDAERMQAMLRLAQRRTRVLISSGNNEPVEDLGGDGHSVFARALLTGLEKMEYDAFSARELFDDYVLPMVIGRSDQEPQYRPIERSGHEGGDIVFVRDDG
jgi:hypothetical protein